MILRRLRLFSVRNFVTSTASSYFSSIAVSRDPILLRSSPISSTIVQFQFLQLQQHEQRRTFAKGIGRAGDRRPPPSNLSDDALVDILDLAEVRAEMKRELELLRDDFVQQLSVRANLQAFERIVVKLPDNSEVALNHLAQVTFKNPQMAIVNCSASPHAVRSIADALNASGLCANPQIQQTTIYVPLPRPSREHREKLVQTAKLLYNRCHDRLRAVDKRHQLQLRPVEKTAPKDTLKNAQLSLHALVKEYAQLAEEMMKAKQKELMEEIK